MTNFFFGKLMFGDWVIRGWGLFSSSTLCGFFTIGRTNSHSCVWVPLWSKLRELRKYNSRKNPQQRS